MTMSFGEEAPWMYLRDADEAQRGQLILGGTLTLLGAAQEQSSARARVAGEPC